MALQVLLPLNGSTINHGTATGITVTNTGTVDSAGKIGSCYSYASTYTLLSGDTLRGLSKFTISCWVYPTSTSYSVFTAEDTSSYWQFVLANGYLRIRDTVIGKTGTRIDHTLAQAIPTNTWTHVTIVYNSGVITIYYNGEQTEQFTSNAGASMISASSFTRLYIGQDPLNSIAGNCKVNDFRVYDHCLSPRDIKEIYHALILHYKLDQTSSDILPAGIELYDSIQGDGNSWINTLIPYDSTKTTYTVKCKFSQPTNVGKYDAVFGAYTSEAHKTLRIIRGASNTLMWGYYNRQAGSGSRATLSGTNSDTKEVVMTNESLVCTVGGTSTTYTYGTINGTDTASIFYLFAQGTSDGNVYCLSKTIIHYWNILDGDTMLGNFIPATFYGEPGMYDTVTKKFFSNDGTGKFTLGNKIDIQEYEYLQCDTASYIKTGVIPTTSTNFEMKYAANSLAVENVLFGCSTNVAYASGNNYSLDILPTGALLYTFRSNTSYSTGYTVTVNSPFIARLWWNSFSVNGIMKSANRASPHPNLEIYLFARNVNNTINGSYLPGVGKLYYCKFWEDDKLIRDFIPVSYNGVLGLFDRVQLKFYSNAGSGTFTAGPSISNIVYDCSGYRRNGTMYGTFGSQTGSPRYNTSLVFNGTDNSIGIGNLSTMTPSGIFTFNVWFKVTSFGSKRWGTIFGGPSGFEFQSKRSSAASPVLVAYSWGQSSEGGQAYELDTWNMATIVRTASNAKFYLNGSLYYTGSAGSIPSGNYFLGSWNSSAGQNYKGYMSDARIYATALTDDDILDLYHTSAIVDNLGNLHTFRAVEVFSNNNTQPKITKTGDAFTGTFVELGSRTKILSDGSVWLHVLHHENPASNLFTAGNCWSYDNGSTLYSALYLLKDYYWKYNSAYELLACEKLTSSSSEVQYRWTQTSNPATSSSITGFQAITGSGAHFIGLKTDGSYGAMHNGSAWWCCCGSYTQRSQGLPGFGGNVTTGSLDLYIRVGPKTMKGAQENSPFSIYADGVLSKNIIEI